MSRAALLAVLIVAASPGLAALAGRVVEVRGAAGQVRAAVELRDVFTPQFRQVLESGGALHVRVEAALWEDRPMWDRAVMPPRLTAFRVIRQPDGTAVAVVDSGGGVALYPAYPDPLTLDIDLAPADLVSERSKYYVDGELTIGTLGDDERDEANEAVFGGDTDPAGLKRIGKFLLNTVLQVSDYVRSASVALRSDRVSGAQLKSR